MCESKTNQIALADTKGHHVLPIHTDRRDIKFWSSELKHIDQLDEPKASLQIFYTQNSADGTSQDR